MRPGSVALLPVSTASTGLLCLSVGAHAHRGRSDIEVSGWLLLHAYHIQCVTYVKEFRPKIDVINILCSKYVQLHYLTRAFKFG